MKRCGGGERVTVVGIVTPHEWAGENHIRTYALHLANEEQVFIANKGSARSLQKALRKRIRVFGHRFHLQSGESWLEIEKWEWHSENKVD